MDEPDGLLSPRGSLWRSDVFAALHADAPSTDLRVGHQYQATCLPAASRTDGAADLARWLGPLDLAASVAHPLPGWGPGEVAAFHTAMKLFDRDFRSVAKLVQRPVSDWWGFCSITSSHVRVPPPHPPDTGGPSPGASRRLASPCPGPAGMLPAPCMRGSMGPSRGQRGRRLLATKKRGLEASNGILWVSGSWPWPAALCASSRGLVGASSLAPSLQNEHLAPFSSPSA